MSITPVDKDYIKHPDSGALILYNNLISGVGEQAGAEKTLTPNTYETLEFTNPSTLEPEYFFSSGATINTIAIGAVSISGADTMQVSIQAFGSAEELLYSATINIESGSTMIELPSDLFVYYIECVFSLTTGASASVGVFSAGMSLRVTQPIYGGHSPIALSAKTKYEAAKTVSGNFIGRTIEQQGGETNFNWKHLDPDWYRSTFQPFVNYAKKNPFFIKWRPDYFEDETAYCWTTKDVKPVNMGMGTRLMGVNMSVGSYGGV